MKKSDDLGGGFGCAANGWLRTKCGSCTAAYGTC